jgi:5-methylcytosine-specific restriction endonuclease McrA
MIAVTRSRVAHKSDPILARDLHAVVRGNRDGFSCELEHIAEFHARKLYLPAAHPSMQSYLVHELHFSPASARKRIHAAGTARHYPVIFEMIGEGRLHLSAVILLAPCLTADNAAELLEAAAGKTKPEITQFLAERFERLEQPMLAPVAESASLTEAEASEGNVGSEPCAPGRMADAPAVATIAPAAAAPNRAPWPITVDSSDHEKLRYAQSLLRHQIPSGDMTKVLSRLIELGLAQLEKQRKGAGRKPRASQRPSSNPRHIPSAVKFAVWQRDGGQCTFTSESGHRCPARDFIELDHAVPVARGGMATIENLRLRCRSHNQYDAECTFGTEFMQHKRESRQPEPQPTQRLPEPQMSAAAAEVVPWLRGLGFKIAEANAAAALCESMECEPLEKRVRAALSYFRNAKGARVGVREVTISGAVGP